MITVVQVIFVNMAVEHPLARNTLLLRLYTSPKIVDFPHLILFGIIKMKMPIKFTSLGLCTLSDVGDLKEID